MIPVYMVPKVSVRWLPRHRSLHRPTLASTSLCYDNNRQLQCGPGWLGAHPRRHCCGACACARAPQHSKVIRTQWKCHLAVDSIQCTHVMGGAKTGPPCLAYMRGSRSQLSGKFPSNDPVSMERLSTVTLLIRESINSCTGGAAVFDPPTGLWQVRCGVEG